MFYIWRSSSVHDLDAVSFFGVGIPILFARCQSVVGGMPYTSEARDKLSFLVLNDKILLLTDQSSSDIILPESLQCQAHVSLGVCLVAMSEWLEWDNVARSWC